MFTSTFANGKLQIILTAPCREIEIILPDGQTISYRAARPPVPALTFSQLSEQIEQFINHLDVNENRSRHTLRGYRQRLGQFLSWLNDSGSPPGLTGTWRAYYAELKERLSPLTVKGHFHILKRLADWLLERGYLAHHPLADIIPPEPPKQRKPKAIRKPHIRKLLGAAQTPRDRALLLFLRDTGCRAEEALVAWGDVNLAKGTVETTGKGNRVRTLFLGPTTRRALIEYKKTLVKCGPRDPLWQGHRGGLTYQGLYKIVWRLARAANLEGSVSNPHSFRHAFGRDTTLAGIPTAQLQDLMGHSQINTTKMYARFDQTELHDAHKRFSPVEMDVQLLDSTE